MNIHYLQHVPFEGLGSIAGELDKPRHVVTATHLYLGENLPEIAGIDALIVMGGPMGIYDEAEYPWLAAEKRFIAEVIAAGKTVLGICLGAQLIAAALGARVSRNPMREIGWFPITRRPEAAATLVGQALPECCEVFHWHGDTFAGPAGAIPLAESEACKNQGFLYQDRVAAFQFHLETTPESAKQLIAHAGDELDRSRYVQSEAEMLAEAGRFTHINRVMSAVLQALNLTSPSD